MSVISLCAFCKHKKVDVRGVCAAFPQGIPLRIRFGEIKHVYPIVGDHGMQFEPADADADESSRELAEAAREDAMDAGLLPKPRPK